MIQSILDAPANVSHVRRRMYAARHVGPIEDQAKVTRRTQLALSLPVVHSHKGTLDREVESQCISACFFFFSKTRPIRRTIVFQPSTSRSGPLHGSTVHMMHSCRLHIYEQSAAEVPGETSLNIEVLTPVDQDFVKLEQLSAKHRRSSKIGFAFRSSFHFERACGWGC